MPDEIYFKKNEEIAEKTGLNKTISAARPNSPAIMKAVLNATKRCNAPIRFVAKLDQVDLYKYNLVDLNDLLRDNNLHKS